MLLPILILIQVKFPLSLPIYFPYMELIAVIAVAPTGKASFVFSYMEARLKGQYVYIIDQARGQDGWILAEFYFCVFMDRDEVEVHKNVKRKRGQYPAILTELAWSIKDLLYGIKSTEKNDLRTCLFSSTEKEPVKC